MGRYISCGIATQIIVYGKGCLQKNKKDLLRRIDKVFNLKYYEEGLSDNDDCICLYLKEDLFNKNFKNLLLELNDLDLFTNYFYDNIKAISSNSYNMSQKDRKKAVRDYLEKNFDLKITRSYEKRVDGKNNYDYYLDNVLELNDEISFFYENYLNCTDIGDGAQFNDNITNINGLYMSLNHIPLYFDFNKINRSFFTVTLTDGKKLLVKMPKKGTFGKLTAVQDMDTDNMTMDDAMDTLGAIVAEALSNNLQGEKITTEYITDQYDVEEMSEFVDNYMAFVNGAKKNPN